MSSSFYEMPFELLTEATIQGEFFFHARRIGLNCVLEFSTPVGRLDAACFSSDWKLLVAIVECKDYATSGMTRQFERYRKIGVPVFPLFKLRDCGPLAERILRECTTGKAIAAIKLMPRAFRGRARKFNIETELDEDLNYKK